MVGPADAGEALDGERNRDPGCDEEVQDRMRGPVQTEPHRSDFDDLIALGGKTGGLQIERDKVQHPEGFYVWGGSLIGQA